MKEITVRLSEDQLELVLLALDEKSSSENVLERHTYATLYDYLAKFLPKKEVKK